MKDFDDFAVSGEESLFLERLSVPAWSNNFQMDIVKEAYRLIDTHDHVLVLLFNQEGDVYWNHSLAFIRKPGKTTNLMLILDANKARDQKIYCYP